MANRTRIVLTTVVVLLVVGGSILALVMLLRPDPDSGQASPIASPSAGTDRSELGTLEIEASPGGVKLAVIGPDRFVHSTTLFTRASLGSLQPGTYRILASVEGHAPASHEVEVAAGQVSSVSVELEGVQ